jgi:hypothetical protein
MPALPRGGSHILGGPPGILLETERARRSGGAAAAGRACVLEPVADSVLAVAVPPAPCRGVPAGVLPRAGGRS